MTHLLSLRVQVPNNHILTKNLYYNYYYPNPKYLNIGYMDPEGMRPRRWHQGFRLHERRCEGPLAVQNIDVAVMWGI